MLNIYLAGKIEKNGWRNSIVDGLRENWTDVYYDIENKKNPIPSYCSGDMFFPNNWPVLSEKIFGMFNYTGPYFVGCDHGCFHGDNTHGVSDEISKDDPLYNDTNYIKMYWSNKGKIQDLCFSAIKKSDIVFAWIDTEDCFGTITELGYATALGKTICIAGPEYFEDMWFVYRTGGGLWGVYDDPKTALEDFLSPLINQISMIDKTESPIEKLFMRYAMFVVDGITPQHEIGKYRVDFAIPEKKIAIEIDGHDYHKTKAQRTNDAKRQRSLELDGWRVIRFTGSEVYKDAKYCVDQVIKFTRI